MATSSPPNPFAALARGLVSAKLASDAVASNLAARTVTRRVPAPAATAAPAAPPHAAQAGAGSGGFAALAAARKGPKPVDVPSSSQAPAAPSSSSATSAGFAALAGVRRTSKPAAARPAPARTGGPEAVAAAPAAPAAPKKNRFPVAGSAEDLAQVQDIDPADLCGDHVPSEASVPGAPASRATGKTITYSDEQMKVIECNDRLIVVDAFAGCAKTTTAVGYANHRPRERILYLCLNKANADEAQARFGANVTAATTHSVAWRAMKPSKERITTRWKPMLLMDLLRLRSAREGMHVMRTLNDFFNSADAELSEKHASQVAFEQDLSSSEITTAVAHASMAWKRMRDPADKMLMPHDAYLKMFALKSPELPYDTIIFDEAQDANPVTLQIVRGQTRPKVLCIGDRHQAIYQFRGSVNAMEKLAVGATHLHLSRTWRFGPRVADFANTLLRELKDETVPIQGMGEDGPWTPTTVTTLSRTNAELFRLAAPIRGEGVHWVGGVDNYNLDLVLDAYHLFARERSQIKDPLMQRKFSSWDEYTTYAEDAQDGEARVMVKVINEFAHDVPGLVDDIRQNAVADSKDAAITLTTAHKSKGLEWDYVRISDDFEVLVGAEEALKGHPPGDVPIQDINLLYVAATRARRAVDLNSETKQWLEDLPTHRANRQAARTRLQAELNQQLGVSAATSINEGPRQRAAG